MTKITEDMRKELRKPLPSEAITQHPTKTYLSSIKAIYVTERMSDVFGVGGWKYKVEKIVCLCGMSVSRASKAEHLRRGRHLKHMDLYMNSVD